MNKRNNTTSLTYVDKSNVVFIGIGVVAFVHFVAGHVAILFQTTDGVQVVFASNDAENGHIGNTKTAQKQRQICSFFILCCVEQSFK